MITLDSNILARLLLRDDPAQHARAVALIADGRQYTAPPTVILELVWVLGANGVERADIARALKALLGLANFKPACHSEVLSAVLLYEAGLDFADALHLSLSDGSDAFLTFDVRFANGARRNGTSPAVELLGG
jgi:predicted nucleic acid-binding protein